MARVTDFLPTPSERELESMRRAVLAIAGHNGHQVEALQLFSVFNQELGAIRFPIGWTDGEGVKRSACIEVQERAIVGKYAREAFCEEVAKLFPPAPPLPPVFLDAGAGI